MSNIVVHQASGPSNEYFLALETPAEGTTEEYSKAIDVAENTHHISVFLTEISGEAIVLPEDVIVRLVDPEGNRYEPRMALPKEGLDASGASFGFKTDFAYLIYVEEPMPGVWGIELDIEEHAHFCCELRVIPNAGTDADGQLSRSLIEFGRRLPETRLLALWKRSRNAATAGDDCMLCQVGVTLGLISIGLGALMIAAIIFYFAPQAAVIVGVLAGIGIAIGIDVVISLLQNLRDEIRGQPAIVLGQICWSVCRLAGVCH